MPSLLGYWNIRGLGQSIRLLLEYVGEDYEQKIYKEASEWTKEKPKLDFPYPNLPYYKDGKVKLTQSNAILKYIGRKHNLALVGESPEEMATVDMLLDMCMDYRIASAMAFYNKDFESLKGGLVADTKERFQLLDKNNKGKKWFAGDKITVADFSMYEYLKMMLALEKSLLDGCDWLTAFIARFEVLEAIKSYQASKKFIHYPFNGQMAFWGAK